MSTVIEQYKVIKSRVPDCVLLLALGDFYEAFGDDAKLVSRVCGTSIAKRRGTLMSGIPQHRMHFAVMQLIAAGHKVAIAEEAKDCREVTVTLAEKRMI